MMRKLFLAISIIAIAGFFSFVKAESYTTILTSYTVVTDTTTDFDNAYPNVAGGVNIDKVIFCTTDTIATPILIGVYNNATSTTAASVAAYYVLSSTNATPGSNNQQMVIDFPGHNPFNLANPGFFKADGDTTHKIYMDLHYR